MGVGIKTIINWLTTFMYKGMKWLTGLHYQGRGRKEKLTKAQQAQLVKLIKDGPEANGFHCGIWNSAMIAEVIWLKFEVRYNLNYLSSLLKKLGLTHLRDFSLSKLLIFGCWWFLFRKNPSESIAIYRFLL